MNMKKEVGGLPYMVDYHTSSHWKRTYITL
jgi:hypothetical protein